MTLERSWGCALAVGAALGGCVTARETEVVSVSAAGVALLRVDDDQGDIEVFGSGLSMFDVVGTSVGRATKRDLAVERMNANALIVRESPGEVLIWGSSPEPRTWWDLSITSPPLMNTLLTTGLGDAWVEGLEGAHDVTATRIVTRGLYGEGSFLAGSGGADIELIPGDGTASYVEADGSVVLALPMYGPYELRVTADPGAVLQVTDLGFDDLRLGDGLVQATRFPATIFIDVRVRGGDFTLLAL
jgi:hypothetical protein